MPEERINVYKISVEQPPRKEMEGWGVPLAFFC
jgi:hypothetical protein